jgi:hypothetical protein
MLVGQIVFWLQKQLHRFESQTKLHGQGFTGSGQAQSHKFLSNTKGRMQVLDFVGEHWHEVVFQTDPHGQGVDGGLQMQSQTS